MNATGILDNPAATRITRVAGLSRRAARTKHRRFIVEGPQGVREAVRCAPEHVIDLYLTPEAARNYSDIADAAAAAELYTHLVTPAVMRAMSEDAQGIVAVVGAAAVAAPAAGLGEALQGARLVAVLTETQDPGNAGTIIRAADAAGADAVVLVKGSVDPTNPKVVRSTAGSLFHLPVLAGVSLEETLDALRHAGIAVLAADGHGEVDLFGAEAALAAPSAWLLGNEARGLSADVLAQADTVVSIPIFGRAESLNVASAAALCLYASARAQHAHA
ncbi:RNA methyltransferase [Actinomyces sp. MRS3W]|uniref:TrmH family RNA methyltransferase n=1 Tax=Actinomyces sp. MRS3W TaxID=2800796 RepID=UPI0028FD181E|nr:RNA methyltransferase [Actinomyces sp. MRS3W]MDU0348170.1 RNA methyltransferase [Actinomyces sp. MRS3W]